jgi:trehalose synthase-fused probable maltokinase
MRAVLWHSCLRKTRWKGGVLTGIYRPPGIAEGEPARPLRERQHKHSPLKDVAGMLRSFHYAAYAGLFTQGDTGAPAPAEARTALEPWAQVWYRWVAAAFLHTYLAAAGTTSVLPPTRDERQGLLDAYLLEKAVYELGYELNNRPDWVRIPLQGIRQRWDAAQS